MNFQEPDTLIAIYDLKVSPVGFDFVTFLAIADAIRHDNGLTSFYVIVIPGKGSALSGDDFKVYHEQQFPRDHAQWRITNVFLPMLGMCPTCSGVTFCQTREHGRASLRGQVGHFYPDSYDIDNPPEVYWTDFEATIMANIGYSFPGFQASRQSLDYVDQWCDVINNLQKVKNSVGVQKASAHLKLS